MEYLQYTDAINEAKKEGFRCFKPYYKWNTFNTKH